MAIREPGDRPIPRLDDQDDWTRRQSIAEREGKILDPSTAFAAPDPDARSTSYLATRILVSTLVDTDEALALLAEAAETFHWTVDIDETFGIRGRVTIESTPQEQESRRARLPWAQGSLGLMRVLITAQDDARARPPDAWSLLQTARGLARGRDVLYGIGLDHVLSVNPVSRSNPISRSNPVSRSNPISRSNPVSRSNGALVEAYGEPGYGGRQPVTFVGHRPHRDAEPPGKRRPQVGIIDTGCGRHPWLDPAFVRCGAGLGPHAPIGFDDPSTDPESIGDVGGPLDGMIDEASGHGTFIAGLVHQGCPNADIWWWRAVESDGTLAESDLMTVIAKIAHLVRDEVDPFVLDVLNLSFGYYHETPQDTRFDPTFYEFLAAIGRTGTVIVCSAGNDATLRPLFPAAWADHPGVERMIRLDPASAPIVTVGALNPNNVTDALFSNAGPWISTHRPGTSLVSTVPGFQGGLEPPARLVANGRLRESLDPDDYRSGFAVWSGTSFAAPVLAAELAEELAADLTTLHTWQDAVDRARVAVDRLLTRS